MRMVCMLAIALALPVAQAGPGDGAAQNGVSAQPQNARDPVHASSALDLFDGIVIDQTMTRPGKEFYQLFSSGWHDQALSERYTISVREQPSARFGSQIHIVFGNRRVFQGQLSPNRSQIKMLADAAINIAYKAVTEGEMQRLLFKDPDVGQDEI
jgi:curli production assembly/transport component CsgE